MAYHGASHLTDGGRQMNHFIHRRADVPSLWRNLNEETTNEVTYKKLHLHNMNIVQIQKQSENFLFYNIMK